MSKLFKLRKWVTLEEAAQYLTISLGEPVSKAQLLKFGIDGLLAISVYFPNEQAVMIGKVLPYSEGKQILAEKALKNRPELADRIGEDLFNEMVQFDVLDNLRLVTRGYCFVPDGENLAPNSEDLLHIIGDWELVPTGSGKQLLIDQFNIESTGFTHGRDVVHDYSEGFLIRMNSEGSFGFLVNPYGSNEIEKNIIESLSVELSEEEKEEMLDEWRDAHFLPKKSSLVVSTAALKRFEQSIEESENVAEVELTDTKEQTYLAIIGALLDRVLELSSSNMTQERIAQEFEERFQKGRNGFGKSNLTKIFAKSKSALLDKVKM